MQMSLRSSDLRFNLSFLESSVFDIKLLMPLLRVYAPIILNELHLKLYLIKSCN